jgi:ferritin-like metal-binding protein YciE
MLQNLQDLYVEQLRDLYNAETQLIQALPKMAHAASAPDLKDAFNMHLNETREHVTRLNQIFNQLGQSPLGEKCAAMEGLIEEGENLIAEPGDPSVKDAALIAAAQRVEHYEIAGYGTVRTFAKFLDFDEAEKLLQKTLDEEGSADHKLTKLAEGGMFSGGINKSAKRS